MYIDPVQLSGGLIVTPLEPTAKLICTMQNSLVYGRTLVLQYEVDTGLWSCIADDDLAKRYHHGYCKWD